MIGIEYFLSSMQLAHGVVVCLTFQQYIALVCATYIANGLVNNGRPVDSGAGAIRHRNNNIGLVPGGKTAYSGRRKSKAILSFDDLNTDLMSASVAFKSDQVRQRTKLIAY